MTSHSVQASGTWPQPSRVLWPRVPPQTAVMGRPGKSPLPHSQGCWQDSVPCVPWSGGRPPFLPHGRVLGQRALAGFIRMNTGEAQENKPEIGKAVACNLISEAVSHHLAIFCSQEASHQAQPSSGWAEDTRRLVPGDRLFHAACETLPPESCQQPHWGLPTECPKWW